MVSILASSAIDRGFGSTPCRVDVNTIKLAFAVLLLNMQYFKGVRAKTGWLGIRIMCPSGRHLYLQTIVPVN
jgi:hypothetical protein